MFYLIVICQIFLNWYLNSLGYIVDVPLFVRDILHLTDRLRGIYLLLFINYFMNLLIINITLII